MRGKDEAGHVITVTNERRSRDPVTNERPVSDNKIDSSSTYLRWSDLINLLLHTGQIKFFSPVWVLMCRASSSLRANFFRQPAQVQGNGLSPENIIY